ncbi:NADH-quinone oxidoreductase subunit J family protein [Streptomyces tsukubensis]
MIPLAAAAPQGFLSPTGVEIAFLLVGLVTLGAAVMTVTTRQLIHAALWLVVALGGLAVEYLLLTAEFIAWVQVLIYVGSVVVLLLFGLMLTKAPIGRSPDADSGNRAVAVAVAGIAAVALVWVVVDAFRTTWIDLEGPAQGSTATAGEILFRHWVLPFEALSVLLLAALVGAIVLSRRHSDDTGNTTGTGNSDDTGTGTGTGNPGGTSATGGTGPTAGARDTAPGPKSPPAAGTPRRRAGGSATGPVTEGEN